MFDESTDWLAYLRTAANGPAEVVGLRDDLETPVALSELATRYAGTPVEVAIADAALTLIESGTAVEMDAVRRLPFERATNAFDRLMHAIDREPERFARDGWDSYVLWKLTQLRPHDPRLPRLAARLR